MDPRPARDGGNFFDDIPQSWVGMYVNESAQGDANLRTVVTPKDGTILNENDLRACPYRGNCRADPGNSASGNRQVVHNRIVFADGLRDPLAELGKLLLVALRLGLGVQSEVERVTATIEAGQVM